MSANMKGPDFFGWCLTLEKLVQKLPRDDSRAITRALANSTYETFPFDPWYEKGLTPQEALDRVLAWHRQPNPKTPMGEE